MKITLGRIRTVILLLVLANFMVLACRLGASSTSATSTPIAKAPGQGSNGSSESTTTPQTDNRTVLPAAAQTDTNTVLSTPTQTAPSSDLSQADLPVGFPIYPGGHGYSWVPGLMLKYTVDADVRTASGFYAAQMGAGGYSDLAGGGGMTGECGGDCGLAPTYTPGSTPTSTPEGWMMSTQQGWMKGSEQIIINYSANPDGTTNITIVFAGK